MSHRGLVQRFAKPPNIQYSEGSNPFICATFRRSPPFIKYKEEISTTKYFLLIHLKLVEIVN